MKAHLLGATLVLLSGGCRQVVGFNENSGLSRGDGASEHPASADRDDAGDTHAPDREDSTSDAADGSGADGEETDGSGSDGGGSESGTYVSPWTFADATCGQCVYANCGLAVQDCGRDPNCRAYEACVAACAAGDAACAALCWGRVPSAPSSTQTWELNHCAATACSDKCRFWASSNGQRCGSWPTLTPDCATCCCPELIACENDPECVAEAACVSQCEVFDSRCQSACTGKDVLNGNAKGWLQCQRGHCAASCQVDDWSCLGKVEWPTQSGSEVYINLTDYLTQTPRVGYGVKECSTSDPTCSASLAGGMTDDPTGNVVLPLVASPTTGTVNAYFEITPPPGEDYPTHLFYVAEFKLTHRTQWGATMISRTFEKAVAQPDPSLGNLVFRAASCNPLATELATLGAAGLQVMVSTANMSMYTLYFKQGTLDPTATVTDSTGSGVVVNLPPGNVVVTTQRASGEVVSRRNVLIRADAVTELVLTPTPR
jgi:hypothetical protein